MLAWQADIQKLKLKGRKAVRFWALYYLGCAKVGWDMIEDDITTRVIRPQRLFLDPDATIDEDGYTGEYVGEYRRDRADILARRFPKKKKFISLEVENKMGTMVDYCEIWTDDYVFWTMKDEVLGKAKNPHWNYDQQTVSTDEWGMEHQGVSSGKNHFKVPKKPYVFLSVFNLGQHPFDDTSNVEQNLSLQDLINKRMRQIDRNTDNINGGMAVSGDHFTLEEAAGVADAVRRGATVFVPAGDPNAAITKLQGAPLATDVFNNMQDARQEIDNVFGTHATTRGEATNDTTVRGKIIAKQADDSRIGLISEYLEQFYDEIYNWWVQLMYVYYDEPHVASIMGGQKMMEYIELQKDQLTGSLLVSVKEGSLMPKDPMAKRNEAIDLWGMNGIDPISLFERLDFADPRKMAEQLYMWQKAPEMLFPEAGQAIQQMEQQKQQAEAQAQMAQAQGQAGIDQQTAQAQAQIDTQMQQQLAQAPPM
jgi:hypothetical protein